MVNHGLTTGALFACVGVLYERYHTREMNEVGGIWNRLPILAFFFILSALGSAALPGLNGFVGEFPILVGMFAESRRAAVLGGTGMILGACYLLWMLRKVVFGPLREPADHEHAGGGEGPRSGSPRRLARDRRPGAAHGADRPDRRGSRALPRSHPTLRRRDRQEPPISARLDEAGRRNHDDVRSGTSSPRRGMHPESPQGKRR